MLLEGLLVLLVEVQEDSQVFGLHSEELQDVSSPVDAVLHDFLEEPLDLLDGQLGLVVKDLCHVLEPASLLL